MDETLFDPEPFVDASIKPRRRRAAKPTQSIETVAVVVDDAWRGVCRKTPGIVHALRGGAVAWCGVLAAPHTFDVGEIVVGCAQCITAGAPVERCHR